MKHYAHEKELGRKSARVAQEHRAALLNVDNVKAYVGDGCDACAAYVALLDAERFTCAACRQSLPVYAPGSYMSPRYGRTASGRRHCWACCGKADERAMRRTGRACLYLTVGALGYGHVVTNWPGTLTIPVRVSVGRHNIAGTRYDVHFQAVGARWHGVTYGDNTQICHCRRIGTRGVR